MKYLVDTNVFLHTIDSNIYGVAKKCSDLNNNVCITQTIMDELTPGYYIVKSDASTAEIEICVRNCTKNGVFKVIELIDISEIDGAKIILKSIRDRFYSWMYNFDYLQLLLQRGEITQKEISSKCFKNKDLGECELLSIAKASHGEYVIITNDRGHVYCHPYQNIFEAYEEDNDVVIYSGNKWIKDIIKFIDEI
ncbi:hypothetical protein [[Clostridium] fimetarium]|uniref:PIN domain-containing protein n=1 Tax=[Clostridium] fimetarium TaxID=99656 RepID=A0A1I0QVD0_9FIRM|nr:hypothetical protein [[Clostridium] fimetarium]SEW31369.1 hypothetical protein SAMN05421659_109142 [[Clostridium] fimetarium]